MFLEGPFFFQIGKALRIDLIGVHSGPRDTYKSQPDGIHKNPSYRQLVFGDWVAQL